MALKDDKKSVLNTISAYSSFKEEKKPPTANNSFKSVNNKDDVVPYLVDTLKSVAGTDALKQLIGNMFTGFIDEIEPKVKKSLKKQFTQYNSDDTLPNDFVNNGIETDVKNVDPSSKLKVDPNSEGGDLLYNKDTPNFDSAARDSIVNSGTEVSFSVLTSKYNKTTDKLTFKPEGTQNTTIGKWFGDFIDDATFIDKKQIMTEVMDAIYGTVTNSEDKDVERIAKELETDALLAKFINGIENPILTPEEKEDILNKAKNMSNGVLYYDMGCGLLESILPESGMTSLISEISGSTDSFATANAIEATIDESTKDNPNAVNENKDTIRDGFFQKIIEIFTVKLVKAVTATPQIKMLLSLSESFQNDGNISIDDTNKYLETQKTFIKCLIKDIISMISEFIFKLAISYLVAILTPVIKKILKERINQYIRSIKSLVSRK